MIHVVEDFINWLVWGGGGILHHICSDFSLNDKGRYGSLNIRILVEIYEWLSSSTFMGNDVYCIDLKQTRSFLSECIIINLR